MFEVLNEIVILYRTWVIQWHFVFNIIVPSIFVSITKYQRMRWWRRDLLPMYNSMWYLPPSCRTLDFAGPSSRALFWASPGLGTGFWAGWWIDAGITCFETPSTSACCSGTPARAAAPPLSSCASSPLSAWRAGVSRSRSTASPSSSPPAPGRPSSSVSHWTPSQTYAPCSSPPKSTQTCEMGNFL